MEREAWFDAEAAALLRVPKWLCGVLVLSIGLAWSLLVLSISVTLDDVGNDICRKYIDTVPKLQTRAPVAFRTIQHVLFVQLVKTTHILMIPLHSYRADCISYIVHPTCSTTSGKQT